MGILFMKQNILAEQVVIMLVCCPRHFLDKRSVKKRKTLFVEAFLPKKKQLVNNVN